MYLTRSCKLPGIAMCTLPPLSPLVDKITPRGVLYGSSTESISLHAECDEQYPTKYIDVVSYFISGFCGTRE